MASLSSQMHNAQGGIIKNKKKIFFKEGILSDLIFVQWREGEKSSIQIFPTFSDPDHMQKCRVNVTDERLHVFHRVGGDLNSDISKLQ